MRLVCEAIQYDSQLRYHKLRTRAFEPDGPCLQCGRQTVPQVDHCPRHGWCRGVLCNQCNQNMKRIDNQARLGFVYTDDTLYPHWSRCPECLWPGLIVRNLRLMPGVFKVVGPGPWLWFRAERTTPELARLARAWAPFGNDGYIPV